MKMVWEKREMDSNGDWKLKQSELNGYIKSQFDSLHESLDKIERKLDRTVDLTNKNCLDLNTIKAQAVVYGGIVSLIVGAFVTIIVNILLRNF